IRRATGRFLPSPGIVPPLERLMPDRRVAVVTGANRGMGLETARQLLAAGFRVALTGRDGDAVERARRALGDRAADAMSERLDVTAGGGMDGGSGGIQDRGGRVDVLVNNAAILLAENDEVLSIEADAFRQTFDTTLFGVIKTGGAFVPGMAARRYGRIVN